MDKTTTESVKFWITPLGALFIVFGGIFLIGGALMIFGVITGSATDTQSIFLLAAGLILVALGRILKENRIMVFERELKNTAVKKTDVVFTSDGPNGEFLQFACQDLYLLDLPANQLTPEKNKRFMELAPNASRTEYQGGYSYQTSFKDAHKAAEFAEAVFKDVFMLGKGYKIKKIERV